MNKKGFFKRAGFSAIIVALTGLTALAVPTLQNGDFSEGLDHWTVDPEDSVIVEDGRATFNEDSSVPSGTLSQEFTIPALAQELSFNLWIFSGPIGGETDVFTASLLDQNGDSLTGGPNFFYWDSDTGIVPTEATVLHLDPGDPDAMTVTLDVSSIHDSTALLKFAFLSDEAEPFTKVQLNNVSIIPAPGALVLGLIGTGAVGLWRRFSRRA